MDALLRQMASPLLWERLAVEIRSLIIDCVHANVGLPIITKDSDMELANLCQRNEEISRITLVSLHFAFATRKSRFYHIRLHGGTRIATFLQWADKDIVGRLPCRGLVHALSFCPDHANPKEIAWQQELYQSRCALVLPPLGRFPELSRILLVNMDRNIFNAGALEGFAQVAKLKRLTIRLASSGPDEAADDSLIDIRPFLESIDTLRTLRVLRLSFGPLVDWGDFAVPDSLPKSTNISTLYIGGRPSRLVDLLLKAFPNVTSLELDNSDDYEYYISSVAVTVNPFRHLAATLLDLSIESSVWTHEALFNMVCTPMPKLENLKLKGRNIPGRIFTALINSQLPMLVQFQVNTEEGIPLFDIKRLVVSKRFPKLKVLHVHCAALEETRHPRFSDEVTELRENAPGIDILLSYLF